MAAALDDRRVDSAIASVLEELDGISSLKPEQIDALKAFIGGRDVLALLPTGFGKSLIYQIAPLVWKKLGRANPIVIVVSPLVALMEDQVRESAKLGVKAVQLGNADDDIAKGQYQLVYGGPERWILQDQWREMLSSAVYRDNLAGLVVDEVHVTYKWGQGSKGKPAFREAFSRLGELRSLVKEGTPVLALTASAELQSVQMVKRILHMDGAHVVKASPNRLNIRLGLVAIPYDKMVCLDWVVNDVRNKGLDMECIIIYCRSLKAVGKIFCHLKSELGDDVWVGGQKTSQNRLIGMYHSATFDKYKDRVVKSLLGNGSCRVVVATTALGMGVNFKNVGKIVLYGPPEDAENILQMVGRAGRDGKEAHAVMYYYRQQLINADKAVKEFVEGKDETCIRKRLYGNFEDSPVSVLPGHSCCTSCHRKCECAGSVLVCPVVFPEYESFENVLKLPVRTREVDESDKVQVRELLYQYKETLSEHSVSLMTTDVECTGFGQELIESVVDHCCHIFTLEYVKRTQPVYSRRHAQAILLIIGEVFEDIPDMKKQLGLDKKPEGPKELPKEEVVFDYSYSGYYDGGLTVNSDNESDDDWLVEYGSEEED
ncbi:putative ATP-dependent DNA helicase RecS [Branchiostoma floridae x Branchiostoma japonicum]